MRIRFQLIYLLPDLLLNLIIQYLKAPIKFFCRKYFIQYVHSSLAPCLYLSRKERQGTMVLRRVTSHCFVRDFPSGKNSHVLAGPLAQDGIVVLHEGFSFGMPEASLLCTSAQKGTHKGISFPLARRRENYPSERTIPSCAMHILLGGTIQKVSDGWPFTSRFPH